MTIPLKTSFLSLALPVFGVFGIQDYILFNGIRGFG